MEIPAEPAEAPETGTTPTTELPFAPKASIPQSSKGKEVISLVKKTPEKGTTSSSSSDGDDSSPINWPHIFAHLRTTKYLVSSLPPASKQTSKRKKAASARVVLTDSEKEESLQSMKKRRTKSTPRIKIAPPPKPSTPATPKEIAQKSPRETPSVQETVDETPTSPNNLVVRALHFSFLAFTTNL